MKARRWTRIGSGEDVPDAAGRADQGDFGEARIAGGQLTNKANLPGQTGNLRVRLPGGHPSRPPERTNFAGILPKSAKTGLIRKTTRRGAVVIKPPMANHASLFFVRTKRFLGWPCLFTPFLFL